MGKSFCGKKPEAALTENNRLHISDDIVHGLDYLHAKGVAHRHVVIENVFIMKAEGQSIGAKLGGHFAARVSCRHCGEICVMAGGSDLSPEIASLANIVANPVENCGLCDARPV